ncbi:MAG: tRNA (adenosine(37)-N6)-threonylcarbamoyltransferase complex ATPase subunit type 1 TsaE [Gemmatimonadaceae bacterium]|nr:tRNA (adenosine(37)-N6)-threonylcarbamoyltransferase complex ATPase subunit type 1 TsaE [Chitinophagaceae bacterium]
MVEIFQLDQIRGVAERFWKKYGGKKVFAFYGEMGAGKTTFVHQLCELLGVKSAVTSPTFAIINEYGSDEGVIYHIDLYRLADEEEAMRAGVEDCIYSGNICMVEWPERIPSLLPEGSVRLRLTLQDGDTRSLTVEDN